MRAHESGQGERLTATEFKGAKDVPDFFHRGAQAAGLHRLAVCRTETARAFRTNLVATVCGKLPQTAGWQPALPRTKYMRWVIILLSTLPAELAIAGFVFPWPRKLRSQSPGPSA